MAKNRLFPFKLLPAAWGLKGDAFEIASANYYLEGEELERALLAIQHKNNRAALQRGLLELDRRYGRIDSYQYDIKIAELEVTEPNALMLRKLDIDIAAGKIAAYDGARQRVQLTTKAGVERDLAMLELDHQFKRTSQHDYEKRRADLREEPWIAIINSGFNPEQGIDGVFFEFDWNKKWIEFLRLNGYSGATEEQIIDDWFTDVCRSHVPTPILPPGFGPDL